MLDGDCRRGTTTVSECIGVKKVVSILERGIVNRERLITIGFEGDNCSIRECIPWHVEMQVRKQRADCD